ncbi:MAG: DHH family phosphoesterase [Bacilli bacterium]|nr:DHH family phosphoesterase [Bacilli bacterium]
MLRISNLRVDLENKILENERIFIMPHLKPDFDAIGASLGLHLIAEKLKRDDHILIGTPMCDIDDGVQAMIEQCRGKYPVIGVKQYEALKKKPANDFNIICDANKPCRVYEQNIPKDRLAIVDHHIKSPESFESCIEYIDPTATSASEIVTRLLSAYRIKIPTDIANMLYAGILLDTRRIQKKETAKMHTALSTLVSAGASQSDAQEYFTEDIFSNMKVDKLTAAAVLLECRMKLSVGEEDKIYTDTELSRTADNLLDKKVDGSFVVGNLGDGKIAVKARCQPTLDANEIMGDLGGGGGQDSAAAEIKGTSIPEVVRELKKAILPKHYILKDGQ